MTRVTRATFAAMGGSFLTGAVAARQLDKLAISHQLSLTGSAISDAASVAWTRQLLNAAYFNKPEGQRDVADLRLALGILNTWWHCHGYRKIRVFDLPAFDRAFGTRLMLGAARFGGATLDREHLLDGAARVIGPWFPEAWADDERRAWGIAFRTADERAEYEPDRRFHVAGFGPLAPPRAPDEERDWHTYPPVPVDSAERVVELLARPETWPDYTCDLGMFTSLTAGDLMGQTFEVEILMPVPGIVHPSRAYVTATRLHNLDHPDGLHAYTRYLNESLARWGEGGSVAVPEGARPLMTLDLTSHLGHFLGRARNTLLVYEEAGQGYLSAVGTWDPMTPHIKAAYDAWGHILQQEFWSDEEPAKSMLCQVARAGRTR